MSSDLQVYHALIIFFSCSFPGEKYEYLYKHIFINLYHSSLENYITEYVIHRHLLNIQHFRIGLSIY